MSSIGWNSMHNCEAMSTPNLHFLSLFKGSKQMEIQGHVVKSPISLLEVYLELVRLQVSMQKPKIMLSVRNPQHFVQIRGLVTEDSLFFSLTSGAAYFLLPERYNHFDPLQRIFSIQYGEGEQIKKCTLRVQEI